MKSYKTNDIYLASYLISSGKCLLEKIEELNGWRKAFVLVPEPTDQDISSFYSGSGTVSALRICGELRSLKAACLNSRGDCSGDR
jgi:hypothetical protein